MGVRLASGAFESPNHYLHAGQLLSHGGARVRPGAGLGRRRTPPKFTCKGLPLRHGESPSEPWRHAPVINRGAFDSPNHYLHAGQLLSRGGTLVGPGNALKNPLTPSVVVSDLVVAGETSSDTFLIAHEELPAPGFSTSTAAGSGFSNKSPTPCSLKLS